MSMITEGFRYVAAGALALALDFGAYAGLIRLADVHYLVAAPIGFSLGLALIYFLSVRWVFRERRLGDARVEFAVFAAIGVTGLALNQLIIWLGVEKAGLAYETAKLVSAALVFGFNFGSRKLALFTRYS